MASKSASSSRAKTAKQLQSVRKSMTPNSLYSGLPNAKRVLQQQRYSRAPTPWRSNPWRPGRDRATPLLATEPIGPVIDYHSWNDEYSKIVTREKIVKSMTKDSYLPWSRIVSVATERITTKEECCSTLISPQAVKVHTVIIQQTSRTSRPSRVQTPTIIRYLRRHELMPSSKATPPPSSSSRVARRSLPVEIQYKNAIVSIMKTDKITGVIPNLVTTNRLVNRVKFRIDPTVIRRPPRRVPPSITHQTIMPLSVYG